VRQNQWMKNPVAPIDRFMSKVMPEPNSGCWFWMGSGDARGYGHFSPRDSLIVTAHRWAYEYFAGPIPPGLDLDHKCRVPCCVNPDHLEPVTRKENVRRGMGGVLRALRKPMPKRSNCRKGHPLVGHNIHIESSGVRRCRTCRLQSKRRAPSGRAAA
jgi:hypothetical protein